MKEFSNFFGREVDKRLGETGTCKINWQEAYGDAIVNPKTALEGITFGLWDMGIGPAIFHNSNLPTQAFPTVTPFIAADSWAVAKAVDEITREVPTMHAELENLNQVDLVTTVVLGIYQVFSSKPLTGLKDIEGGKVAGAGEPAPSRRLRMPAVCGVAS